jgi:HSP20 family protein
MAYRPVTTTVLFLPAVAANRESSWLPGADIYRSRRGWLIKLDLAGVRQGDVTLKISGDRLVISGCRRDLVMGQDWNHYSMEISYTRFERAIELPCSLERADISTELSDGMLLIYVIPKGEDDECK